MLIVNIECASDQELKDYTRAKGCLVGEYLALKISKEKFVRILDLKGRYLSNRDSSSESNQIAVDKGQSKVNEHQFRKIDITGMIDTEDCAADSDLINLRSMRVYQV